MELLILLAALGVATAVILLALHRMEKRMNGTLDQVNAALANELGVIQSDDTTVVAAFAQVNTDLQTLITDYKNSGGTTDFTPQLEAIAANTQAIQNAFTAVSGAVASADSSIQTSINPTPVSVTPNPGTVASNLRS